jgi:hypothetical protein
MTTALNKDSMGPMDVPSEALRRDGAAVPSSTFRRLGSLWTEFIRALAW